MALIKNFGISKRFLLVNYFTEKDLWGVLSLVFFILLAALLQNFVFRVEHLKYHSISLIFEKLLKY